MHCREQFHNESPEYLFDQEQRKETWKKRPVYSAPVKIANWNEDLFLEEEKERVASYKRDHCQLLIQKTRKIFKNLLKSVILAPETPYVLYGYVYQIQACDLPNKLNPDEGSKATYGLYLSGIMNERDLDVDTHFIHGCGLCLSPDKAPCVRNTFLFVGCDGQSNGQSVYYGDDVYIRISESGTDSHLYLQCENATMDDFGGHLQLRLTQSPDLYCRFKVYHWNPNLRDETAGSGFPPNARVIIKHSASGRNLAGEYTYWIPTLFGAECSVSCHTYRDTHKLETAENYWKIVSDVKPDINLYVRAAKGEDIPVDLLN
ncbi:hypothetical protein PPYR_12229 [Photinus pyralis]|uniref:Uncharacterized protein n=2 Tax=Photinus pyralis TaxID=7054 RepID=A0A5N4ADI4_PHOPY|nr:cilia- and flagella-associated protein 161 [Photinus pyralis]KAB0795390.1 hypothetical protein PPYR_12229 [Photinus pyralis]